MTYYNLPPTRFANEYNDFEKSLRALPAACPGNRGHGTGKLFPCRGEKGKFMNIQIQVLVVELGNCLIAAVHLRFDIVRNYLWVSVKFWCATWAQEEQFKLNWTFKSQQTHTHTYTPNAHLCQRWYLITVITSNYGVQFEIHPKIDNKYASIYQANAEKLFCPARIHGRHKRWIHIITRQSLYWRASFAGVESQCIWGSRVQNPDCKWKGNHLAVFSIY